MTALGFVFSPDGHRLAIASQNQTVTLWGLDGQQLPDFKGQHAGAMNAIAFSPNCGVIASASGDQTIKLWNLEGQLFQSLQGYTGSVNDVCFSPDTSKPLLISASRDAPLKPWHDGEEVHTLKAHNRKSCRDQAAVRSIALSPDSQQPVFASNDHTIKLWPLEGQLFRTLRSQTLDQQICREDKGLRPGFGAARPQH